MTIIIPRLLVRRRLDERACHQILPKHLVSRNKSVERRPVKHLRTATNNVGRPTKEYL